VRRGVASRSAGDMGVSADHLGGESIVQRLDRWIGCPLVSSDCTGYLLGCSPSICLISSTVR
jgi:hypothetical protein